jgi:Zn-dependent peptidase ImmA (M78 family)
MPANAAAPSVAAYATYARVLAEFVVAATTLGPTRLPDSPDQIHSDLEGGSGVSFRDVLDYAWEHGVVVLPLKDPGAFHAALWDIDGVCIVVLKQSTRTSDRWAFDLAHEFCHAVDHASGRRLLPDGIVDDDSISEWAADPDEQRANRFAGRALLGLRADALAKSVADQAGGKVDRLKRPLAAAAAAEGVSAGALANYVAFRLARQGINWWGAATNMQDREEDPWRVARDALLARLNFGALDEQSRGLLVQALSE